MVNFTTFDLNLLRVLDAILQEGSTVRAGDRLGLSQPAVSSALRRLREALGDDLFFRRGQGLEPTQYALALREPLREALDEINEMLHRPETFDPTTSDARFRLSGSDFFAELLMPRLADWLAQRAPRMRVHLVDLVPDSYIDTIERYEVDLALVPEVPLPDWLQAQPLFRSAFVVIARQNHPRLKRIVPGEVIPLDLFCDLGHVLFSPEGKSKAMGDAALAAVGRERRVVMTMPAFSGVYKSVAVSDLIGLLPTQLAHHVAVDAGLSIYEPPMPVPVAQIVQLWHRRQTNWPAHVWLREQIATLLSGLDEDQASTASRQ